jgi:hypothetical protein
MGVPCSIVATLALVSAAALTVSVAATSCGGNTGAQGSCPDGASCGGDPSGSWKVTQTCQFSPPRPIQPLTYTEYTAKPQDPLVPPVQPLPSTSGDWCSGLFYPGPGAITNVELWHDTAQLTSGTLTFSKDKTYQANLTFQARDQVTHFATACLETGGFSASCSGLQTDLTSFYAMAKGQNFKNIRCTEASTSDGGCDCTYTYEVDLSDQGTWSTSGGLLFQNSQTYTYNGLAVQEYQPQVPTISNYCVRGGMTMTGYQGASLSGVLGLRTLTLSAAGSGGM